VMAAVVASLHGAFMAIAPSSPLRRSVVVIYSPGG
jgi:hypothetical protein